MSVHVHELHTDVTPAPAALSAAADTVNGYGGEAEERFDEARRRAEYLTQRVAAVGFDD